MKELANTSEETRGGIEGVIIVQARQLILEALYTGQRVMVDENKYNGKLEKAVFHELYIKNSEYRPGNGKDKYIPKYEELRTHAQPGGFNAIEYQPVTDEA